MPGLFGQKTGLHHRRSNSMSHIPVLSRESRLSRTNSVISSDSTQVASRKISLDRRPQRPSSLSNFLRTPLQQVGISGKTSVGRKVSPSPYSVRKERPVNDKRWVAEQFRKIHNFLETQPACDPSVVNNLKPPTINTFIHVCNILFKEVDPRMDVHLKNYKENVIAHLKSLHYPGNVSLSLLKTVNVMHSWPQVISIFSWLIDLLNFINNNTISEQAFIDTNDKLKENILHYFSDRYLLFNKNTNQASCDEDFIIKVLETYGIVEDKLNNMSKEVKQLKTKKQELIADVSESTNKYILLQNEVDTMKQEMQEVSDKGPLCEEQQEKELQVLIRRKVNVKGMIVDVKKAINKLKIYISSQPCTYEEKKRILAKISEMKYTVHLKKEKNEKYLGIKKEIDYKLFQLKKKLEAEVFRLNTALMEIAILYPDVKSLNLRDKGLHNRMFTDEVIEFIDHKSILEDEISEKIESNKSNIDSVDFQSKQLCDTIGTLHHKLIMTTKEEEELKRRLQTMHERCREIVVSTENLKSDYITSINNLKQKEPNLEQLELEISSFSEEKVRLESEFVDFQLGSLKFFEAIHGIVVYNLKDIEQMRVEIIEKVINAEKVCLENHENLLPLIEFLRSFESGDEDKPL